MLNVSCSYLKYFEVSVSQFKKSECLGLAKKNANIVSPSRKVSHLPFTTPSISLTIKPLVYYLLFHSFGGGSIVAIGDLFQLELVMDEYIFEDLKNLDYVVLAPRFMASAL